jgi:hypothetical protein
LLSVAKVLIPFVQGLSRTPRKPPQGIGTMLMYLLVTTFSAYCLVVCPTDYQLESRACRGLNLYREQVLDPLLIRPLYSGLQHPSVSPYVEKAVPVITRTLDIVIPLFLHTVHTVRSTVVPVWDNHLYPRVRLLEIYTRPQRKAASNKLKSYVAPLSPYVEKAKVNAGAVRQKVEPYVTQGEDYAQKAWVASQPALSSAWEVSRKTPGVFYERVYVPSGEIRRQYVDPHAIWIYRYVAEFLSENRREYVDPHVLKLWAKVQELAGVKKIAKIRNAPSDAMVTPEPETYVATPTPEPQVTTAVDVPPPTAEETSSGPAGTTTEIEAITSDQSAAPTHIHDTTEAVAESIAFIPETSSSSVEATVLSVPVAETLASASAPGIVDDQTVPLPSSITPLEETPSPVEVPSPEVTEASLEVTSPSAVPEPTAITAEMPDHLSAQKSKAIELPPVAIELPERVESTEDLDAFLRELEIGQTEAVIADVPTETDSAIPVGQQTWIPSNKKPSKEATAEKRLDIETRHTEWETQLQALSKQVKEELRDQLTKHREKNAAYMADGDPFDLKTLTDEANRVLRNADTYGKALTTDHRKSIDEKEQLWGRIVSKVTEKFTNRVKSTEDMVNMYWGEHISREADMIIAARTRLESLAGKAQADVGMDYAWLDDVTYRDWQVSYMCVLLNILLTFVFHSDTTS